MSVFLFTLQLIMGNCCDRCIRENLLLTSTTSSENVGLTKEGFSLPNEKSKEPPMIRDFPPAVSVSTDRNLRKKYEF